MQVGRGKGVCENYCGCVGGVMWLQEWESRDDGV